MLSVLLSLLACDGGEAPPAAPAAPEPAPAPAAPPPAAPAAPEAPTEPPEHWPVGAQPGPDGVYDLSNHNGDELPPAWQGFETFHGGYGGLRSPSTSSQLAAQGSASYGVGNLNDDDHKTAWVEGVAGTGKGEWIEFTFGAPEPAWTCSDFVIVNGYQKSEKTYKENGRVKSFDLLVGGKKRATLHLEDLPGNQVFKLPVDLNDTVRLVITETYPGSKYEDTAITEMWVACGP